MNRVERVHEVIEEIGSHVVQLGEREGREVGVLLRVLVDVADHSTMVMLGRSAHRRQDRAKDGEDGEKLHFEKKFNCKSKQTQ